MPDVTDTLRAGRAGARLKEFRVVAGVPVGRLCAHAVVDPETYSRAEAGQASAFRLFTLADLFAVLAVLDVSPGTFFHGLE